MHIEADLLRAGGPGLVAEAVHVLAVALGVEAVIARGDGLVVHDVGVLWVDDLLDNAVSLRYAGTAI